MVTEERIYQFWKHINLLGAAIDSGDKKRIADAYTSMKFTEEEFMEFPIELVAQYQVVSKKALEAI
jgi:hypothetical protein